MEGRKRFLLRIDDTDRERSTADYDAAIRDDLDWLGLKSDLVVRQSDRLPGQGWWITGARLHDYSGPWEGPRAGSLIRKVQRRAFDYWRRNG